MFALRRKPKPTNYNHSDFNAVARQYPGKLVILPNHIIVHLGDVGVTTTIFTDTTKLSGAECLELALSQIHPERHHQIHL